MNEHSNKVIKYIPMFLGVSTGILIAILIILCRIEAALKQ